MNTRMAGTEGTYEYKVLAETPAGRIGIRELSGGQSRIRVEPVDNATLSALPRSNGWKQPGDQGQPRHSIVAANSGDASKAVTAGLAALVSA